MRHKTLKTTCGATLIVCLVAALNALAQQSDEPKQAFEQVEASISDKQSLKASKERKRTELRGEIAVVQEILDELERMHTQLQSELADAEQQVEGRADEVADYTVARDEKTKQLVWSSVTASQLQKRNPITMLILQSDPLKVDRLYQYHAYFTKQLKTQIDELRVHLAEFDQLLAESKAARENFVVAEQNYAENSTNLQDRKASLGSLNAQLETEIEQLDADLAQLFREREQLSRAIAARTRPATITTAVPTPSSRGDISNWPVVGKVRQAFGTARADGRIRSEGIVIAATVGTPVTAIANGTVVFSQWFEGYGNTIIVDHGDEIISIYARCDTLLKQTSEPVEAGEQIATVGMAEESAGLYFEIRVRNNPTDPLRWLRER